MLLHIEMPPGWRLLAAYPLINGTAGEPSGESVVCVEHTLPFGGGHKVYLSGRVPTTVIATDPTVWAGMAIALDPDTAMFRAIRDAGWSRLGIEE